MKIKYWVNNNVERKTTTSIKQEVSELTLRAEGTETEMEMLKTFLDNFFRSINQITTDASIGKKVKGTQAN